MKNLLHRILVFLHLKDDFGFTQLMYRGHPVIADDDTTTGTIFLNDEYFMFKSINRKKYKGRGRPRNNDYNLARKPKVPWNNYMNRRKVSKR